MVIARRESERASVEISQRACKAILLPRDEHARFMHYNGARGSEFRRLKWSCARMRESLERENKMGYMYAVRMICEL